MNDTEFWYVLVNVLLPKINVTLPFGLAIPFNTGWAEVNVPVTALYEFRNWFGMAG